MAGPPVPGPTKPNHPWTNNQVERMNCTIKETTVNRDPYENHEQLRAHLADFVTVYNFARRFKILNGFKSYVYIRNAWTKEPGRFDPRSDPANAGTKR